MFLNIFVEQAFLKMQCFLALFLLSLIYNYSICYKPVVIVHGLLDNAKTLSFLATYIEKIHPGTNVTCLNTFSDWQSLAPLWIQIRKSANQLLKIMDEHPEGLHIIGYSQGGLVARGLITTISNHNIQTFVSLSSPQMGQYGETGIWKYLFPKLVKKFAYKFFYTLEGQLLSVGNYWHDPHHEELFMNMSAFLPLINNQVEHSSSSDYKKNFLKLKHIILIGGPDDGVLQPWQTSHFGFFNGHEQIVEMTDQWIYRFDTFGLRTLDKNGAVKVCTISGVNHFQWHKNQTVIDKFILPYLD